VIKFPVTLFLLLASSIALACEPNKDDPLSCITGSWAVFLPNAQGKPAPNIELRRFLHQSPDDRFGQGIAHEELMNLHERVKKISADSFSASKASFEIYARFTLTPDKPVTFDLQTDGAEKARAELTAFYNEASALKDFHSKRGTVYVIFNYAINPKTSPAVSGSNTK
jgi:hypothetical protein